MGLHPTPNTIGSDSRGLHLLIRVNNIKADWPSILYAGVDKRPVFVYDLTIFILTVTGLQ